MIPAGVAIVVLVGLAGALVAAHVCARRRPYDWERDGL